MFGFKNVFTCDLKSLEFIYIISCWKIIFLVIYFISRFFKSNENTFLNSNNSGIAQLIKIKILYSYRTKYGLFNKIKFFNLNKIISIENALKVGVS